MEVSTAEHQGPGGGGVGEEKGLFQEDLARGQRNRGQLETLLSTELPVPFEESTSLSRPRFLYPDHDLWRRAWALGSGLVLDLPGLGHLGVDQMAQTGRYNSLSGFLGQRAATDPAPEGPRSDGDSTQRVDSLLERWRQQSQVPTGTKNPTGKPRVRPGPGKPAYAWLDCRDPHCAVVAAGPEDSQGNCRCGEDTV